MPKFVIEREMPEVGHLSDADFKGAAQKSCDVLQAMGPEVQWIQSFVTENKIYCVYHAADESLIREHAERSGFPASKISKVERVIDPATAEA
ncbi:MULTISPECIES: DUF4242 domain-containing protein [Microvirga]|uniref:DUF4242 domain-containing protein n=1 Tax=Microvirga TaxID=186650 RepID=UPI001CFE1DB1|nr:DUF4242 domain-containing protein [Microvirga lenta]MCB5174488.1 DUF4242 domain-containing protein [Microvirga lenta]